MIIFNESKPFNKYRWTELPSHPNKLFHISTHPECKFYVDTHGKVFQFTLCGQIILKNDDNIGYWANHHFQICDQGEEVVIKSGTA